MDPNREPMREALRSVLRVPDGIAEADRLDAIRTYDIAQLDEVYGEMLADEALAQGDLA